MMSRPEISSMNTWNRGSVRPMIQESEKSSKMREITAKARPIVRALACSCRGSFPAEDRNKDDVVHTQDKFKGDKGDEGNPYLWVSKPVHER